MKLASIPNFRDIGGYHTRDGRTVRYGRLYRSGYLGKLSPGDRDRLDAAGIRSVIDLRSQRDIAREGGVILPAGARSIHLNVAGDSANSSNLRYVLMSSDRSAQNALLGAGKAEGLMTSSLVQLALGRTAVFLSLLVQLSDKNALPAIIHFFFFFNDTATTEIYTLSLHDALPSQTYP